MEEGGASQVAHFLINYGIMLFDERTDMLHFDKSRANLMLTASQLGGGLSTIDLANREACHNRIDWLLGLVTIAEHRKTSPAPVAPRTLRLSTFEAVVWKHICEKAVCVAGAVFRLKVSKNLQQTLTEWKVPEPERFAKIFNRFIADGLMASVGGTAANILTYGFVTDPNAHEVIVLSDEPMNVEPEPVASPEDEATKVAQKTKPKKAVAAVTKPAGKRRKKPVLFGKLPDDLAQASEHHLRTFLEIYRGQGETCITQLAKIEFEITRRLATL